MNEDQTNTCKKNTKKKLTETFVQINSVIYSLFWATEGKKDYWQTEKDDIQAEWNIQNN